MRKLSNKFKYINIKQSVLLRLIKNGESLEDASSKAGLCINLSKYYLKPKYGYKPTNGFFSLCDLKIA